MNLTVIDIPGRRVAVLVNQMMESGSHDVKFDARALASDIYFYRIQAGPYSLAKKLCLIL